MKEALLKISFLNILLLVLASGADTITKKSEAVFRIASPYTQDSGKIYLYLLAINLCLSLAVIMSLIKRCEQNLSMICFMLKDANKKNLYIKQKEDLYKYLFMILLGKILTDSIFNLSLGKVLLEDMIFIEMNFILSTFLWLEIIYSLCLREICGRYPMFIIVILNFTSHLVMSSTKQFSVFAYAYMGQSVSDLFSKLIICMVCGLAGYRRIIKKDLLV